MLLRPYCRRASCARRNEIDPQNAVERPHALPPYSPDFNPIENAFAKLRAVLRKAAERTVEGLWSAIGRIVELFSADEYAKYFSACGYDPDRLASVLAASPTRCARSNTG